MSIWRISFVCDDLVRMARFWLDTCGIVAEPVDDPLAPERQGIAVRLSAGCILEYTCFPGLPGDRGSGDLRRIELVVDDPDVWARLQQAPASGGGDVMPDGRVAILDPVGLLLVCACGVGNGPAGDLART